MFLPEHLELVKELEIDPRDPLREPLQARRWLGCGTVCHGASPEPERTRRGVARPRTVGGDPGAVARRLCRLTGDAERALAEAVEHMALSGRGFDRTLKVARTVADLDGAADVDRSHVDEALGYRALWLSEAVAKVG